MRSDILDAARRAPLAHEPFFFVGVETLAQGRLRASQALLAESLRRDPRSRLTRILLLDLYLRTDQVEAATTEIAILTRLMPAAQEALVATLADFATRPATFQTLQQALRRDPLLLDNLLKYMASHGSPAGTILALASSAGARQPDSEWRSILLNRIVSSGDIAQAFRIWRQMSPRTARVESNLLYDPTFADLRAPAPFGWRLESSGRGASEATEGALFIDYYGREPTELAKQMLQLGAGAYRFSFAAEGDASGEGSKLTWSVSCAPKGPELGVLELAGVSSRPRQFTMDFRVPATGCTGQWLTLRGVPHEFPELQSASFRGLRVIKAQ